MCSATLRCSCVRLYRTIIESPSPPRVDRKSCSASDVLHARVKLGLEREIVWAMCVWRVDLLPYKGQGRARSSSSSQLTTQHAWSSGPCLAQFVVRPRANDFIGTITPRSREICGYWYWRMVPVKWLSSYDILSGRARCIRRAADEDSRQSIRCTRRRTKFRLYVADK